MTAYNAVISLKNTMDDIFFSCRHSLVFPSVEFLALVYEELEPLQEILQRLDSTSKSCSRKKVNALDGRIRETLWNFEDLLESLVSDEIISQFEGPHPDQPKLRWEIHRRKGRSLQQVEGEEPCLSGLELELNKEMYIRRLLYEQIRSSVDGRDLLLFSIDLQRLQDDVYSFIHTLSNIVDEYITELDSMAAEEDEDEDQYPIPIDVGFKLLRELDALQLRFYTFPTEILTLVQLKYLALTCNGELPATIYRLFRLRVLIIHPHVHIGDTSYIPIQIWDMADLEHIGIFGQSLRAPNHFATLQRLSTLVGVNANIATIFYLSTLFSNIRKLGVQIELTPSDNDNDDEDDYYYDDADQLISWFSQISTLESLETLKCSIINPSFEYGYAAPSSTPSSLMFSDGLKKLHLSGMGFPWEYTDMIGSLPSLQVLKLRSYAFQGPLWETQRTLFSRLKFLLIEDSDLVQWKPSFGSFSELSCLSLKHCYALEELEWPSVSENGNIEMVDCNPLALSCAKKLKAGGYLTLLLTSSSSFDKPERVSLDLQG